MQIGSKLATVTQTLNDYIQAFGADVLQTLPYYYAPLTIIGPRGPAVLASAHDVEQSMLTPLAQRLSDQGWDRRSEWAELHVKQLSDSVAIASGVIVRDRTDGSEIERIAATYVLNETEDGWKIVFLTGHDAASVLTFDASPTDVVTNQ